MTKVISFFNNKGGTGKTTLSCNMAAALTSRMEARVLYIDGDPQCNATQLLLPDNEWEGIFSNRRESVRHTLLQALAEVRAGDSTVVTELETFESKRFGVSVLAGHPGLSVVEDKLSASWGDFKSGDVGGARRSLWVRTLASAMDFDLVIIDMGPSLGALNRTFLLGSDYFVTPMSADLFSLYALDNISDWMGTWVGEYSRGLTEVTTGYPDAAERYGFPTELPITRGYVGYTVQQYVSRASGGKIREVQAYERHKSKIPDRVKQLSRWSTLELADLEIGIVPNMFSMVPLAQAAHAPIAGLKSSDGLRGAQVSQNANYVVQLNALADRLAANLRGLASPT